MSEAKKDQGNELYPGVDNWKPTTLKAGTLICQLDYRPESEIKQTPASNYFANGDISVKKVNEQPSSRDLSEQVQVKPFRLPLGIEFTYQPFVAFYEVKKDFQCEASEVKNNPLYGRGGVAQYFIGNKDELAKTGHLELQGIVQTSQRSHNLPLFKEAEKFKWNDEKLSEITPLKHEEILKKMESGDETARKAAAQMRELMKESRDLKEGKAITADKEPSREEDQNRNKGLRR